MTATIAGNVLTLDSSSRPERHRDDLGERPSRTERPLEDSFTVTVTAVDDAPVVVNAISDLSANEDAGQRDDQLGERIQRRGRRQRVHHEGIGVQQQSRSRDRDDRGERPDPRLSSRPNGSATIAVTESRTERPLPTPSR